MSSHTMITVPKGMSCVNAFHALWENSKPATFFETHPDLLAQQEAAVGTAEKVTNLFQASAKFDYVGGRLIKIDFSKFPKLEVSRYNQYFGRGSAQKAMETYLKRSASEQLDPGNVCQFTAPVKKSRKRARVVGDE